jgi:small-conductance mechanosensitive channel
MTMMNAVVLAQSEVDELTGLLGGSRLEAWDFARAGIILAVALVVARLARFVVRRLASHRQADSILGDLLARVASYLVIIFGCLYALDSLGVAIGPLLGALGIAGFALAFALQDVVENFVAGLILQASRPFSADDEIETGAYEGTVQAVDARTITIHTLEGETVRLPTAEVIKEPIVNHTQIGRRRTTVEVGVAYGTDLDEATDVIHSALARLDSVLDDPRPEVLLVRFGESSIDFSVLFWHGPSVAQKLHAQSDVVGAIDSAFRGAGITIPFPQRDVHLGAGEVPAH